MERDWGGKSLMVRPRILMYPSAVDGVKEGGVGREAESARDVGGEKRGVF